MATIQAGNGGTTNGTSGDDTIFGTSGVDNIYGGDGNDVIYGYDDADNLRGVAGQDILYGGVGADQLDGGIGDDIMYGGVGNDTYVVDSVGDQVIELPGEGIDTVKSYITYTLGNTLENLSLQGNANLDGTGNASNNVLLGNNGNNVLHGLDGDDSMRGGLGNDVLSGGAGNDFLRGDGGGDCFEFSVGDVIAANASDSIDDLNFTEADEICLDGYGANGTDLRLQSYLDIGTFLKTHPEASIVKSTVNDNAVLTITRPDGHTQSITIKDASGLGTSWAQIQPYLPPAAGADSASTGENTVAVIDVLANDTGPGPLSIQSASAPSGQGSVSIDNNGMLRFDPGTDFDHLPDGQSATVMLTYVVQTPFGRTATGTVTVTVIGANDVATIGGVATGTLVEDTQTTASGMLTVADVDDGQAMFEAGTFTGTYGALTLAADGSWTYALDPVTSQSLKGGQTVSETITVHSADGTAKDVVLQITGTNDAATFGGTDTGAVVEDGQQTASGALTVSDADGGEAGFQAGTTTGTYGALVLGADGSWTYTLDNAAAQSLKGGQVVTDAITVHSTDGTAKVINVTVTGTNDAAVIGGTVTGAVTEDTQTTANGLLTITDADAGEANFQAGTTAGTYGSLTLAANGAWTYALDNAAAQSLKGGQVVTDAITVKSADGTTQVITVTVTGTNDAAVIGGTTTGAVTEDVQLTTGGTLTISDADSGESSFQAGTTTGSYGALTLAANGVWTYQLNNAAAQSLKGGQQVTDAITVKSVDGTTQVIIVTVNGTNDAAVIGGTASGAVVEDGQQTATGTLTISDVDTGEASFQAGTTAGSYGSLVLNAAGAWTYTLNNAVAQSLKGGQVVTDAITVKSVDGTTKVISVTVTGANDAAVIGGTATGAVTEDTQLTTGGTLTISDADSGEASFQAGTTTGTYGALTLAANGVWSYALNNASVQSLRGGQQVTDSITVKSADGTTKAIVVTVTGTNDAAVIGGTASGAVAEDGQQTAAGTLTVSDVDTGEASFQAGTVAGSYGSLVLNAAGAWTYTLNNAVAQSLKGGQVVTDAITVKSLDGTTKIVNISVTGANDAATIGGTVTGTVTEDTQLTATGKLTVTDVDTGESSFQAGTIAGSYGSLALAADGNWTYSLNNAAVQFLKTGETRTDTLVVKSADGTTKSVVITVKGTDDAAVIGGCDTGSVKEDCDFLACGKLTVNDADSGQNSFNGGIYKGDYGYVLLCADGGWIYVLNNCDSKLDTLNDGQSVIDAVTIKSIDGTTHAINITVNGQNECPTLACAFNGTGDANDMDNYKTGAVAFSSIASGALASNNVAYGTTGGDSFDAKAGNDTLYGWAGNDCLTGNTGDDKLYGGSGADTLWGGADNDVLYGGSGNDVLQGEAGNDVLVGGFGADKLTGGSGADTFKFVDVRDTGDTITDFLHGTDKIDLSHLLAGSSEHSFASPYNATKFSVGHDLIWYYDGCNTIVLGNTDNNPNTAEFVLTLAGKVDLSAGDFIL